MFTKFDFWKTKLAGSPLDPLKIGKPIGCGLNFGGEVYKYEENKALKIIYGTDKVNHESFLKVCEYLKKKQPDCVVKIYDFGILPGENIPWYLCEKLKHCTVEFREDLKTMVSAYFTGTINLKLSPKNQIFWKELISLDLYHRDFFPLNIMRDGNDNLKMIDIESFDFKKKKIKAA